ncbi:MAG: NAD(P)-dependent oxidoreductase [Parcubacteria group bacterium]|nr:NAD(P)-dependent oxidoreductase [Parcubacteria group bacterium]
MKKLLEKLFSIKIEYFFMKIFVTGGTGFIGRRLVDRLSKNKNNQVFIQK